MSDTRFWIAAVGVQVLLMISGCASSQSEPVTPPYTAQPLAEPEPASTTLEGELVVATAQIEPPAPVEEQRREAINFSSDKLQGGCVQLTRLFPSSVLVGEEFAYVYEVENSCSGIVDEVVVHERSAQGLAFHGATPRPSETTEEFRLWQLGSLRPGEVRKIEIRGQTDRTGDIESSAWVEYRQRLHTRLRSVQPAFKLERTVPQTASLCAPVPVRFKLTNIGTGPARDVRIVQPLPELLLLLETPEKPEIVIEIAELAAGESAEFIVECTARSSERIDLGSARVSERGGITGESRETAVLVQEPELEVDLDGPAAVLFGRTFVESVTVTNHGDENSEETILVLDVPFGLSVETHTRGGTLSEKAITWNLGSLAPGATQSVEVTFQVIAGGETNCVAIAEGNCGIAATRTTQIKLTAVPALNLEVVDREDPLLVGEVEVYEIRLRNDGAASATNIRLACALEKSLEFIEAIGAPITRGENGEVVISFSELGPQMERVVQVSTRVLQPGEVRFAVTMKSDELDRPVEETVATRVYP